jgi:hypothetical protein
MTKARSLFASIVRSARAGHPLLPLALALLGPLSGIASCAEQDSGRLRLVSLKLDVSIDYEKERLSGLAGIEIENAGAERVTRASLLLGRLMVFDAVHDSTDRALPFRHEIVTFADSPKTQVNQALIELDPPLRPGERRVLNVRYSGYLVGYTETGSLYIRDHIDKDFTILREDAYAFPVVGWPSWEANKSVERVDFPFEVSVTVPSEMTVASGGDLMDRRVAGEQTTWSYRSRSPAPFLNLAVAHYELLERDGVRLYAFPKDRDGASRVLKNTGQALALFTRWFGPTATPARFAVIEIPDSWGSQASLVAGIIQTADVFQPGASLQPLYHEVSHFWNPPDAALSCRWNEGLASYLQRRAAREIDGWKEMDADLARRVARLKEGQREEHRLATVPFKDYGKEGMTDWSYSVGLLMFALLDRITGPEAFNQMVGAFYQEHSHTPATCEEFSRFIAARGGSPVKALMNDWFETSGWWAHVSAGESLDAIGASYLAREPQRR